MVSYSNTPSSSKLHTPSKFLPVSDYKERILASKFSKSDSYLPLRANRFDDN
jgi:hypothetical protein